MEPGDVAPVETGECTDVYYVETGMFDTTSYGSVYIFDTERPAIVDTGTGTNAEYILDALDEVGIGRDGLEVIAPTHVHLDHAGGAGILAEENPDADVFVHEIGAPHLVDPERLVEGTKAAVGELWQYYVDPQPIPEERIVELSDGDHIDLGDRKLVAHHVPGHAPHQVVFESPDDDAVCTADAAGIYVPELDHIKHTSPPPTFDLESVLADVETIRELDPSTLLYSHFGPAPVDEHLGAYERVIADWVERVEAKRDELGDDEAVIEYFVENVDEGLIDVWGEHRALPEARMDVNGVLTYLDYGD